MTLRRISSAESVRRMRERGSASDLDILAAGVWRDIILFVGAVVY